jgi:uncharacterized protein (TIGR02996 family)
VSEEDGFIQAILGDPDDDTPRLVFADWLEERGEPRAEFIRAQCALAERRGDRVRAAFMSLGQNLRAEHERAPGGLIRDWLVRHNYQIQNALTRLPADEKLAALQTRERELLAEHELAWVGPIHGWVVPETYGQMGEEFERGPGWQFRRGFIESVFMDPSVFLTVAAHLFRLAPIREVTFLDPQGGLSALMASHWFANLTMMTCTDELLRGRHLGYRNIQVLLKKLALVCPQVTDAGVKNSRNSKSWRNCGWRTVRSPGRD